MDQNIDDRTRELKGILKDLFEFLEKKKRIIKISAAKTYNNVLRGKEIIEALNEAARNNMDRRDFDNNFEAIEFFELTLLGTNSIGNNAGPFIKRLDGKDTTKNEYAKNGVYGWVYIDDEDNLYVRKVLGIDPHPDVQEERATKRRSSFSEMAAGLAKATKRRSSSFSEMASGVASDIASNLRSTLRRSFSISKLD